MYSKKYFHLSDIEVIKYDSQPSKKKRKRIASKGSGVDFAWNRVKVEDRDV